MANKSSRPAWSVGLMIGAVIGLIILIINMIRWFQPPTYSDSYRDNFMSNCTDSGLSYARCKCSLDYVQQHYTYQQAMDLDAQIANGITPPEVETINLACGYID
jgi:hypothetical protein